MHFAKVFNYFYQYIQKLKVFINYNFFLHLMLINNWTFLESDSASDYKIKNIGCLKKKINLK